MTLVRRSHGMESGQGHLIRMSGGRVTDSLTTTVLNAQLGNQITVAANATLVQDGRPGRSTRSRWDGRE